MPSLIRTSILLPVIYCLSMSHSHGQQKTDSVDRGEWIKKMNESKQVQKLVQGITRRPPDASPFNERSEEPFLPYEGKIVRSISVQNVAFGSTVLDTARNLRNFVTRTANQLHRNTREYVIRNYLFVKAGRPLNPYRAADNERALRNLDFIMDARIYVKPIAENSDSVDLLVITRDVFSPGASFNATVPNRYYVSIRDINLDGGGQRVQIGQALETTRNPRYGYEGFYQLNNIGGTFLDASAGYTKLNDGISLGYENEQSLYFKLSRTLFQPFARWAGEIAFSDNKSNNVYSEPDSSFATYRYQVQDYWAGYSLGYKKSTHDLRENRNRKFIAVRAYQQYFLNASHTDLTERDRYAYRNRVTVLGQFTFFHQDFYKTQYVVGFGRTEDIPYGYRVSFTGGWERELGNHRPYAGVEVFYNYVRPTGTILSYNARIGSYWDRSEIADGLLSVNVSRYSRIHTVGNLIVRHRYESGYARLFNQQVKPGMNINDVNGLLGFRADSLAGIQRLTFSLEEIAFMPWKILGFRLAVVARTDLGLIQRDAALFETQNFFSGFSLGIRSRNENLIFNTIETRLFFYPKTVENINPYLFKLTTNFRIRYPTNLVSKPATVFQ